MVDPCSVRFSLFDYYMPIVFLFAAGDWRSIYFASGMERKLI